MARAEPVGEPLRIGSGEAVVTVRKVHTGTGERAEVLAERLGRTVRLDAIALESLAWQDSEVLGSPGDEREDEGSRATGNTADEDGGAGDRSLTISNEYALARIERVAPDRLEVAAPKLGYRIQLGLPELEWLTGQSHEVFTEWLETPFGPVGEDHEH